MASRQRTAQIRVQNREMPSDTESFDSSDLSDAIQDDEFNEGNLQKNNLREKEEGKLSYLCC